MSRTAIAIPERRKQLFEAATAVFARKGYANSLIEDIATEAGIGKGTIYRVIDSKDDLVVLVKEEGYALVAEKLRPITVLDLSPEKKLRRIIQELLELIHCYRETIRVVMNMDITVSHEKSRKSETLQSEIFSLIKLVIDEGIKKGVFSCSSSYLIAIQIFAVSHFWATQPECFSCSLDEYTSHTIHLVIAGLKADT